MNHATAPGRTPAHSRQIGPISFPEELPVTARRGDIARAIAEHQVVVIAGETGSGKTTQIPKICLSLGRGLNQRIGHTQPRRIAARSVAERIAEELGTTVGETVGYAVRFTDEVSPRTAIKLMTDGILLAEIHRDPELNAYDTIIIDEAHERSLNIDFLLGYLKRLLPRRPDLKLIITSATIDPESFARFFATAKGEPAPVVEVSGRTYPVEVRYRDPLELTNSGAEVEPLEALADAVVELLSEPGAHTGPADILVFFSGEREIREAAEHLRGVVPADVELLPLFARLSTADQMRVFRPQGKRRIVLATNVAETSLTVPGIRYVIDTGVARISRYSVRTKVQRLPVEAISQASANQRAGRCGRLAAGICIRLYSEADFESRAAFTDPEILRTNLASVIVQMAALELGPVEDFAFLQPPDRRAIRDGLAVLTELGALEVPGRGPSARRQQPTSPQLTAIGRQISRLPTDPRLARVLIEAQRRGVLSDALTVVAGMSIHDPRERPVDHEAEADRLHGRFQQPKSDVLSLLTLWDYLGEKRQELSSSQYRKLCRAEYLHYLRIREWQDLRSQLQRTCRDQGWATRETARQPDELHQAVLAGFLSHIGTRPDRSLEFKGARGISFKIFPGSGLAKKPPRWVVCAEMVETSQLWGRQAVRIDPLWIEPLAQHLTVANYSDPHWSTRQGRAMVNQKVSLWGLTLVEARPTAYAQVDPQHAHELFVEHALVQGEWQSHHEFLTANSALLTELEEQAHRTRTGGAVPTEEALNDFYLQRVPRQIASTRDFDKWWKQTRRTQPNLLTMTQADLAAMTHGAEADAYPDTWAVADARYQLRYRFAPGDPLDGLSVEVPVPHLAALAPEPFTWLVPGFREELVEQLLRTLPKQLRRTLTPIGEKATQIAQALPHTAAPIQAELARYLTAHYPGTFKAEDFRPEALPDHLRINLLIIDKQGREVGRGKELAALARRFSTSVSKAVKAGSHQFDRPTAKTWTGDTWGNIPQEAIVELDGQPVTVYPALTATAAGILVTTHPTAAAQRAAMMNATLRLLLAELPTTAQRIFTGISVTEKMALSSYPHGGKDAVIKDIRVCAVRDELIAQGGPVWSADAYRDLLTRMTPQVATRSRALALTVANVLATRQHALAEAVKAPEPVGQSIEQYVESLTAPSFVTTAGADAIGHYLRYLQAAAQRARTAILDPAREARDTLKVSEVEARVEVRLAALSGPALRHPQIRMLKQMLHEFRVSIYAQKLGTPTPISEKRIRAALEKLPD